MKNTLSILKIIFFFLCVGLFSGCIDSGGGGGGGTPGTVVVIGDSISGAVNYPGVSPWPEIMAGMVPETTIINSSRAGDEMEDGLRRLGGLLAEHNPDVLVIFFGSNNAIRSDVGPFKGNLEAAIQAGRASGAKVLVVTPPYMYQGRSIYNGNIDLVVADAKSAASANGAKIVNINKKFGMNSEDLFPDGLHPNTDGQRIIAMNVRERL